MTTIRLRMQAKTLARVKLSDAVSGRGNCRHIRCGEDVTSQVAFVRIAQYEGDYGFYVFYEDQFGRELNDLSFDSVSELIDQIASEFDIETAKCVCSALSASSAVKKQSRN